MFNKEIYEKDATKVCKDFDALTLEMQQMVNELKVIHPELKIVETWRSQARQNVMYKTGKSQTLTSRHNKSQAIDYIHSKLGYNAPVSWWTQIRKDWKVISAKRGKPNVGFPNFELGHLSVNNGEWV